MSKMSVKLAALAACAMFAGALGTANAKYPDRPITMIIAYDAGGGTDVAARTLAPYIEKYLGGGNITVINRPGAGGAIGFSALARAKPDGYTIGFINTPNYLTSVIEGRAQYKLDQVDEIANIVSDPSAFSVLPDSGIKSLSDLVEYAKANPEKVTYTSTGVGSDDHLAALAFERATGVKMTHVPLTGNAVELTSVLGGHVMLGSINISEVIEYVHNGKLRVLGQMADKRWDGAPDVPTFKELGYDIVIGSDRGIAGPAGMPEDIKNKLAEAVHKAVHDPEFIEKAKKQHLPLNYLGPKDYTNLVNTEYKQYEAIWEEFPWISKSKK